MRLCSASACRIDWRIHHTAYEINLKPRVSSNFSAALISPEIPLVDQVRQRQALVLVLFRNGNHEPKVGASQFFEGFLVALFNPLRQIYLFLYGNQILFANLLQVFVQRCAFAIGNGFGNF